MSDSRTTHTDPVREAYSVASMKAEIMRLSQNDTFVHTVCGAAAGLDLNETDFYVLLAYHSLKARAAMVSAVEERLCRIDALVNRL